MKLRTITDIQEFQETINSCEGPVWLESPQGDRFDLKSLFSQYVALGQLLGDHGDELELFCQLHEDEVKFYNFFFTNPSTL